MKRLAIVLLAILYAGEVWAYGVANCVSETSGTQLTTKDMWQNTLQTATPGTTYLFRAGTYTISGTLAITAANITLAAYDCEAVMLAGIMSLNGSNDGLTIRNITTDGTNKTAFFNTTANGTDDVTIQNVTGLGGNNSWIRARHSMARLTIDGVDVDNIDGQASCSTTTIDIAGTTAGVTYRDLTITNSKIQDHACEGGLQINLWSGTLTIENNYVPASAITGNNSFDIKSPTGTTDTVNIKYNTLLNRGIGAGAALLIHGNAPPAAAWPVGTVCNVEGNWIEDGFRSIRNGEAGGEYGGPCTFKNNVLIATSGGAELLRIVDQNAGNILDGNVFYNGVVQIDTASSANVLRNNVFHTATTSIAQADYATCDKNNFHSTTAITGCTNNNTDNPNPVNIGTRDWNLQQTSLVNAGTTDGTYNGSARDIGLVDAPVPTSCVVADATPTKVHLTWANNTAPPMTDFVNGSFTVEVDASPVSISSTVLQSGATSISEHTVPTINNAEVVTIAGSYGAASNSACLGGPEVCLNMKSKAFNAITCDNQVGAGAAAWTLTQTHYRTRRENNQVAVDTPISIPPGQKILVEFQIDCTDDDCPPTAVKMRYDLNGGGYTALSNTQFPADNVAFVLTGNTYIPDNGTAITSCLVDTAGNDVAGAVQLLSAAVPNIDLAETDCAVNGYGIEFDTDAVIGSVYSFCPVNQDGSELNGGCTSPAIVTIQDFPGVPVVGTRPQATGRTQAVGRTQAGTRAQVIQ